MELRMQAFMLEGQSQRALFGCQPSSAHGKVVASIVGPVPSAVPGAEEEAETIVQDME